MVYGLCSVVHRKHGVDRVPGFLSSRSNRLLPPSHPQVSVALPPLVPRGGTHSLAEEGAEEPIRTKGQKLWYSRYSTYNPTTMGSIEGILIVILINTYET
jgi:hypothetical protein